MKRVALDSSVGLLAWLPADVWNHIVWTLLTPSDRVELRSVRTSLLACVAFLANSIHLRFHQFLFHRRLLCSSSVSSSHQNLGLQVLPRGMLAAWGFLAVARCSTEAQHARCA